MRYSGLLTACLFLGLAGASCAQKQAPPASSAPGSEQQQQHQQPAYPSTTAGGLPQPGQYPALDSLEDAERAYAEAEQALSALYTPRSISVEEGAAVGGQDKPLKPAPPPTEQKAGSATAAPDRCVRVCQALASLERARDAICRLTSADDARCERANISVEKNRTRAAQCACPKPPDPPTDTDSTEP